MFSSTWWGSDAPSLVPAAPFSGWVIIIIRIHSLDSDDMFNAFTVFKRQHQPPRYTIAVQHASTSSRVTSPTFYIFVTIFFISMYYAVFSLFYYVSQFFNLLIIYDWVPAAAACGRHLAAAWLLFIIHLLHLLYYLFNILFIMFLIICYCVPAAAAWSLPLPSILYYIPYHITLWFIHCILFTYY